MKRNFYLATITCFFVVIIASILVIDDKFDILNSVKSEDGYVNLDKDFVDKNFEIIQTTTGQDESFEIVEAEKDTEKDVEKDVDNNINVTLEKQKNDFSWPVKGEIEVKFSPDKVVYDKFLDEYSGSEEVTIKANKNDKVLASEKGTVIKISDGIIGQIIEIKHEDGYVTTYSNVCDICVEENEYVEKNQQIAKVNLVDDKYSILRFSMKKDGKNIDPSKVIK